VWFEHVSDDARRAHAVLREVLGWQVLEWERTGYKMIMPGDTSSTRVISSLPDSLIVVPPAEFRK
jgi:hypothetical protein